MKARPILFSGAMVRSLIAETKTQTRRIVKPQPQPNGGAGLAPLTPFSAPDGRRWRWCLAATGHGLSEFFHCPYGVPGDLLWVRESLTTRNEGSRASPRLVPMYAADWEGFDKPDRDWDWSPSIHMPRWASRLTLEITDVRVERLADINEADALAEGVLTICPRGADGSLTGEGPNHFTTDLDISGLRFSANAPTAAGVYQMLWEHINGDGSWAANPWVWALSFNVHRQNVDAVLKDRGAA